MKECIGVPWVNATYIDGALHPLSAAQDHARLFNFPSISITS